MSIISKVNLLLVVIEVAGSFFSRPFLPAQIPMHWNMMGQVDSYWPKNSAIWFFPILVATMWLSFQVLPHFDPQKANYHFFQKEWEMMQMALIGFFAYLQFLTFYIALHPSVALLPCLFFGLGILFILIGKSLPKIRQNYFIGFKLPWTLADKDNWNKTHHYAGRCFIMLGIIILVEAVVAWHAPLIIFGSILLAVILPTINSFVLFKKTQRKLL